MTWKKYHYPTSKNERKPAFLDSVNKTTLIKVEIWIGPEIQQSLISATYVVVEQKLAKIDR